MAKSRAGGASLAEPATVEPVFAEPAFAKINLTLRVLGRRTDGYHELESLVCFAAVADRVIFRQGGELELRLRGPTAADAGAAADNLVLTAARALAARVKGLKLGRFGLIKRLPVGAGLGGGSADAAAALRLLARANGLAIDDTRLRAAARATGADVPVCLDPQPRWMRGIGERLSEPLAMPKLHAVLVHPGIPLATKDVFAALRRRRTASPSKKSQGAPLPLDRHALVDFIGRETNDLEPAATRLAPIIGDILTKLREQPGCALARVSGSGSACYGLFASRSAGITAARAVAVEHPNWWIRTTTLGPVQ